MGKELEVGASAQLNGVENSPVMIITTTGDTDGKESCLCGWFDFNNEYQERWFLNSLLK